MELDERRAAGAPAPPADAPATLGGRYRSEAVLGRGGTATVLKVRDLRTGEPLAAKVLPGRTDPRSHQRFQVEVTAMSMLLDHPNVLGLRDAGEDEDSGAIYLITDWARRGTALDAARAGRLSIGTIAAWLVDVSCALAAAHALGVVHCDVKPSNVLIWDADRAVLGDFGIARVPELAVGRDRVLGSPAYMAPEQYHPLLVGPAVDLYAVGATMFALATRTSPQHLDALSDEDPRWGLLPDGLRPVVQRATRSDPSERHDDIRALALDLVPFVPDPLWHARHHVEQWLAS